MSAFALVFDRRRGIDAGAALAPVLERLRHRGPDGRDIATGRGFALAHLHFWTTPEEVGERQPLTGDDVRVVFCGRLDNRDRIATDLGLEPAARASDAALFRLAFSRWREEAFSRLLGPCAVVVVEPHRGRVLGFRDPLGDRAFYFHVRPDLFAAASEEAALLALPGVSSRLDEDSLARFFAPDEPLPGRTFFADIEDLRPGEAIEVTAAGVRRWQAVSLAPTAVRFRRDRDYVERFRELLGEAVGARLRAPEHPAVLMSGGLDSTSVATAAARLARERGQRLRSVSYVFDELSACDERRWIHAVVERSELEAAYVLGDPLWPLREAGESVRNPNNPLEGPYRRLRDRSYQTAAAGGRVLLTGEFGDELFAGGEYWLASLVTERRLFAALGHGVADRWWRLTRKRPRLYSLKGAVGRLLGGPVSHEPPPAPWLTERALAVVSAAPRAPLRHWGRPSQAWTVLHPSGSLSNVTAPYHAVRSGIELRRPFRDRRLVEFALGLPAHLLYRPGQSKWILREAMRGELPEAVRTRRRPTSLQPLLRRGLLERAEHTARELLLAPDALWRPYVREAWVRGGFPVRLSGPDGPALVTLWRCMTVEMWRRGLLALGEQADSSL